jgi:hypothetical protein
LDLGSAGTNAWDGGVAAGGGFGGGPVRQSLTARRAAQPRETVDPWYYGLFRHVLRNKAFQDLAAARLLRGWLGKFAIVHRHVQLYFGQLGDKRNASRHLLYVERRLDAACVSIVFKVNLGRYFSLR